MNKMQITPILANKCVTATGFKSFLPLKLDNSCCCTDLLYAKHLGGNPHLMIGYFNEQLSGFLHVHFTAHIVPFLENLYGCWPKTPKKPVRHTLHVVILFKRVQEKAPHVALCSCF